ncbi:schwannomin-interacting protein 1 homolog isoform X2 [Battus philenor]|uniref:schwannomin-interacting protein 1 homolog isoform X2 n=1 Tax=Battus philenor TaxID=42288 RepID=UPI0035CED9D8
MKSGTKKLESEQDNNVTHRESSSEITPLDEEKTFEQSDTDEMSENVAHPVPRGIVNPNYPGFQHLAHTLQDYSSNIESFYHSENEMTDDDLDAEATYQQDTNKTEISFDNNNIDNYNTEEVIAHRSSNDELQNDIPDLLKTVSNNNNIESSNFDCSATDIENNFDTKDIIGDFNKEIEDEIKQLLNYNINIQDDLEELRKDIKDTFAKPIENTINNISDVVNHVIKKLVETQNESDDNIESNLTSFNKQETEELNNIKQDNEKNTRTEMNLSRPTFLLIDNHPNNKIKDAILSDGKDEINIYENDYDTDVLSHNVENTIKQLSTELRKIIPKLNEMRERDKLWTENIKDRPAVMIDRNSNEINSLNCITSATTSNALSSTNNMRPKKHELIDSKQFKTNSTTLQSGQRSINDRYPVPASTMNSRNIQNVASVLKNDCSKEYDFETFDVYNIETALPEIDLDAIENHLKAAKEAERRKRNDREEIRKRLAMDADNDEYYSLGHTDRPGKKPSLHSRLQNGTKLRPSTFMVKTSKLCSTQSLNQFDIKETDFYTLQSRLQTEARIALAQAKEMAHIQMERERHSRAVSPVTEMLRHSMEKANAPLAPDRRRVSRQLLTDMNIAQLQVIVNELHSQIETLNDTLVKLLMARDELHMGQDSMLVDIEDLTRYFGVKEQTKKTKGSTKSGVRRLTSLVHK